MSTCSKSIPLLCLFMVYLCNVELQKELPLNTCTKALCSFICAYTEFSVIRQQTGSLKWPWLRNTSLFFFFFFLFFPPKYQKNTIFILNKIHPLTSRRSLWKVSIMTNLRHIYYFSLKKNHCSAIKHKRRQNPGLNCIVAKRHAGHDVSFLILQSIYTWNPPYI